MMMLGHRKYQYLFCRENQGKIICPHECPFARCKHFYAKVSEHTNLFGLNGEKKPIISCEDLHNGFRAILYGKTILLCTALVSASIVPFLCSALKCAIYFVFIELN